MKNSGFSHEGSCRSLGNKTEVNHMKRVKDRIELLHDLLVLSCLSNGTSTSKEAASREPASQHIRNVFPLPSGTFWANRGHQPVSVSGHPTTGRPTSPPKAPLRLTTPITQTHVNSRCLQEGPGLGEFQQMGFLPVATDTRVHGQRQCEPSGPLTEHKLGWAWGLGCPRLICFAQEREQKSLRAECPNHGPCAVQRAALAAFPAEGALLCKIKYSLGQRTETQSCI